MRVALRLRSTDVAVDASASVDKYGSDAAKGEKGGGGDGDDDGSPF